MVVIIRQQLVAQLCVVRQLPVERETKPLVLLQVVTFEGLRIVEIVLAAGRIAHVPDRGPARIPFHDAFGLAAVTQPKHLADAAQAAVGLQQLLAVGQVAGHPRRKLSAVLYVEQNPRHQPRNLIRALRGQSGLTPPPGKW